MQQYVIIGNGVAAAGCIEGIRRVDQTGKISVISAENHPVYCRPLISYYLEGKTDLDKIGYRSPDFYDKMGCEVYYGKKAVKIDPQAKTVLLDDGTALPYTAVCAATGSSPFVPPMEGLEQVEKKFSFLTLDDTLALEQAIRADSRVLIVGAGLIGLKCAEGLHGRVQSITVCDLADRVLSSILDTQCAAMMQTRLEENGISFLLGDSVAHFEKNTAQMKSGKTVDFDVLVLAVGVRANTALVRDAGGTVNRGIVINDRMQTDLDGVYAAGDCAEGMDISLGEKRVLALLPSAYMQGRCAGINMAGGDDVFDRDIPMNSIGFFGLHAMTAGSYLGEVCEEQGAGTLKRLYVKDGRLVGFILIGVTDKAGIYTALIREKTPLANVDFDLLKKNVTFSAFSGKNRRKILGGVV